ncbi:MAG: DUF3857 and transglutaminase domain-containing protein, partial [Candidatus Acidiferrum sp.]
MRHPSLGILISLPFLFALHSLGQQTSPPSTTQKASSQTQASFATEPYVVNIIQTRIHFDPDGKGVRETTIEIRIQSESAVRNFGLLVYPYMASFENLDVVYARVRKPDGTVINTPAGDIQDLDSAVSREAPMYTDQREKHIAVRALAVGDILEVSLRWIIHNPVAPGHFWYDANFFKAGICLKEVLQIEVPGGIPIRIVGSNLTPSIRKENGFRIYNYQTSHLKKETDDTPAWEKDFHGAAPPNIQISSFSSWPDVGAWYSALQQPALGLTPEIRAKAAELTAGKLSDDEKIRSIYNFVSLRFRYIGIDLGLGRYAPHSAQDVLANRYGDCKDKHTLFSALLAAAGIKSFPALVSTTYKINPQMPSPSLFDHVITAIPRGDTYLFLDTTPEVAPFGLLLRTIRDHQALVIPPDLPARLVQLPADPPFLNSEKYQMDSTIDANGVLDGKARFEDRGDSELLFRLAYRNTAQNQWNDLVQRLVANLGFGGTVSDVLAAQPEDTSDPFWFTYTYHRSGYSDWKDHRISLPFPPFILPELSEKEKSSKDPLPL